MVWSMQPASQWVGSYLFLVLRNFGQTFRQGTCSTYHRDRIMVLFPCNSDCFGDEHITQMKTIRIWYFKTGKKFPSLWSGKFVGSGLWSHLQLRRNLSKKRKWEIEFSISNPIVTKAIVTSVHFGVGPINCPYIA